ncbi:MAG: MFS transporter, partial [Pseudomonadota bacterium]
SGIYLMRRVVIAGMIGNGLEWYDFALYGYFAPVIGKLFFPENNDVYIQMLGTYGIFAAGFLLRPVGAVFFGFLGDKFGRKFSLALSIFLMAVPTACIGLLPTYQSIGIYAPILLLIMRLLQGLALAGQFSGSMAFLVEHAPKEKRALVGSSAVVSLCLGMLLGSLVATLFARALSVEDFESWGWRVPFILGFAIALVGFYIRHHTEESPHYEKARDDGTLSKTPVRHAFQGHFIELLRGVGIYLSVTVPFYTLTVFFNGFMISNLGLATKDAYFISTVSMILMTISLPFFAHLTDVFGRKKILMPNALIYFVTAIPIFVLMSTGGFNQIFLSVIIFTIITSCYISSVPALLVELFPTSVRYTGMALSYNVAAVLGGFTPIIEHWLVKQGGNNMVASYIMLCALISFISFIGYHDSYKEELR